MPISTEAGARFRAPISAPDSPQDSRFANLLDGRDEMYGFIAHAAARPEQVEGAEVYLELVLEDGSCLFRPLTVTPFESADLLPQLLQAIAPHEPELSRIVEEHLAPFLESVRPRSPVPARAAIRAIHLGTVGPDREIAAIIPFGSYSQLQPILALLAGTPEAEMLDLALVTSRRVASEALDKLSAAFGFFGLRGSLTIASEHDSVATQLDLGVAATTAKRPAVLDARGPAQGARAGSVGCSTRLRRFRPAACCRRR